MADHEPLSFEDLEPEGEDMQLPYDDVQEFEDEGLGHSLCGYERAVDITARQHR